jgi:hypothetical protein
MADGPLYRTLRETPEFTAQFDELVTKYSLAVLGPVLDGILWGIASSPKGYDRVTWNIREARNDTLGLTIPILRIFFSIEKEDQEDEHVLLLWIEEIGTTGELRQS